MPIVLLLLGTAAAYALYKSKGSLLSEPNAYSPINILKGFKNRERSSLNPTEQKMVIKAFRDLGLPIHAMRIEQRSSLLPTEVEDYKKEAAKLLQLMGEDI